MSIFRSNTSHHRPRPKPGAARPATLLEPLEGRALMAAFSWTAQEVYLAELVNRARANPMAEGVRLGLDLTSALTAGELARLVRQEPLALNAQLTQAARLHSQDMGARNFFSHINPDGLDPTQRATAQGYDLSAGENIAAGYASIDIVHRAWLESLGHRKNVLSLHEDFDASFHYDEFGPGFSYPTSGADYTSYYTQLFGVQGGTPDTFVLGVVYTDTSADEFYSIGEGLGNVRIDVYRQGGTTIVGTYTTDAAGNYQIALGAGEYTMVFRNQTTGLGLLRELTIGEENVKVDAQADEITQSLAEATIADTDAVVVGSSDFNNALTVATKDNFGNILVFRQGEGGAWSAINLTGLTVTPTPSGQVVSWADAQDGRSMIAAPSASGVLLFRHNPITDNWAAVNLTEQIAGASNIVGELTVFIDVGGFAHLAGLNEANELVLYSEDYTSVGTTWNFYNISAQSLAPNGIETPAFNGNLISYVTSWNGLNIAGLDFSGNIQTVWWAPGLDHWQASDLSAITGAPAIDGGLNCYLTAWGGINLTGINADGDLVVTWWVPEFGGNWVNTNMTDAFSGPALTASSVTSYVTSWGGLNVTGKDESGKVVVYWWSPGMESWSVTALSDFIEGADIPAGFVRGATSPDGTISLLGVNDEGHVFRYWWQPGGSWAMQDITALV